VKSCYKERAISNEILKTPSQHPRLKGISLRPELASLLPRAAIMQATEASSGGDSGADNRREATGKDEDNHYVRQ